MRGRTATSLALLVLVVVTAALVVASLGAGALPLSPAETVSGLFGGADSLVVQHYRLPRVLICLLAGAGLAVSGVLLQAAVRNPLASPDVIGVTKGASLGALVATVATPPALHRLSVPLGITVGAALVTALLLLLARQVGQSGPALALVGVGVAALAGAGVEYVMVRVPKQADQALVWLAGSAHSASLESAGLLALWLLAWTPAILLAASFVDRAGFDDGTLLGLGHRPAAARALLVVVSTALAGGAVAVVGGIGFIGLLGPHAARLLVGPRARVHLPAAALCGAALLCAADLAGRLVALPNEVPAGIVAAVIGGPLLLLLLYREAQPHVS